MVKEQLISSRRLMKKSQCEIDKEMGWRSGTTGLLELGFRKPTDEEMEKLISYYKNNGIMVWKED